MVVDRAGDMWELPSRGDGYLFCKDAYARIRWSKVDFTPPRRISLKVRADRADQTTWVYTLSI